MHASILSGFWCAPKNCSLFMFCKWCLCADPFTLGTPSSRRLTSCLVYVGLWMHSASTVKGFLREVRGPGRVVGVVLMTAGEQKLQARLSLRAGLRNRFTGVLCKLRRLPKSKCLGAVSPLITFALSFFPSSLCLSPPPFFFLEVSSTSAHPPHPGQSCLHCPWSK